MQQLICRASASINLITAAILAFVSVIADSGLINSDKITNDKYFSSGVSGGTSANVI